jgi:phosphotransferase system IIB component
MEVSNNTLLNILLPNNNKVIQQALQNADLNQLLNQKNTQSSSADILKNLFNDILNHNKSNETVLNLLKNSMMFKDMGNLTKDLQSLMNLIKTQNITSLNTFLPKLQNFLVDISKMDAANLKTQINQSGVFLESKLAQMATLQGDLNPLKQNIAQDMKTLMLQLQQEISSTVKNNPSSAFNEIAKMNDKILTHIDFSQLMSLTSNTNYVYVPFMWNLLEEGSIATAKTQDDKFYCQINLQLKEFGKVNMLLAMHEQKSIDITMYAQKESFKQTLQENIQELKINLNAVGLKLSNLKILSLEEQDLNKSSQEMLYETAQLNYGLNIRV